MKMRKVIATSLVGVMSAMTITACGNKVKLPEEPAEIYKVANEQMQELDSYAMDGSLTLKGNAAGQDLDVSGTINAVYFKEPMKMKMDMNISAMGQSMDMSMYFMKEDDNYTSYTCAAGTWMKQTLDAEDEDNKQLIDMLENGMTATGDDSLDYSKYISKSETKAEEGTTALDFSMNGEQMAELLSSMGMDEQMAAAGVSTDLFKGLGEFKATFVLDNKTAQWKSMDADMTEFMQGLMDTIMDAMNATAQSEETEKDKDKKDETEEVSITIDECKMNVTYDKLNEAEDFELPEEAKNAQDISDLSGMTDDIATEE